MRRSTALIATLALTIAAMDGSAGIVYVIHPDTVGLPANVGPHRNW